VGLCLEDLCALLVLELCLDVPVVLEGEGVENCLEDLGLCLGEEETGVHFLYLV